MTRQELLTMYAELQKVFDLVRLVDATMQSQIELSEEGDPERRPYRCFDIWNKSHSCQNCTSSKALMQKGQFSKFELVEGKVHYIISKYIEIDGQPYVMELINKISNETLFGAFGKTEILQNVMDFSKTMYVDSLTGAYNRRFFEEQFCLLENQCAVAFVDFDHFKEVNDNYGHDAGDLALRTVVKIILSNIRAEDSVVRYGGDEFLISFGSMPKDVFESRLLQINKAVGETRFDDYPDLKITVSVGGFYSCKTERMQMVKEADKLCYEAKIKRDCVQIRLK